MNPRGFLERGRLALPALARIALVHAIVFSGGSAGSTTLRVPGDQPTIQAGIDAAADGDTVLVSDGGYQELGIVMKSGVHLVSETRYGVTIGSFVPSSIDEDAIICIDVDATASIDGFRFDGNYLLPGTFHSGIRCEAASVTIRNCLFENWTGPGIRLINSSPRVESSTFSYCGSLSVDGGGIYAIDSSPLIINGYFSLNEAARGGAIWCGGTTSAAIEGCTFNSNRAVTNGAGIYCEDETTIAGGLFLDATQDGRYAQGGVGIACSGSVEIQGVSFLDLGGGSYVQRGGGIYVISGSVTIAGCMFDGCFAPSGGAIHIAAGQHKISGCGMSRCGAQDGGGIAIVGGSADIERTTIIQCSSYMGGAAIHVANASANITLCTIIKNYCQTVPAAGVLAKSATVELRQTILRKPCSAFTRDLASIDGSTVVVECCAIDSTWAFGPILWGSGNFSEAPSFCSPPQCGNALGVDLRVTSDSPCLPENNSCSLPIGAVSESCGTVSLEPRSWGSIKASYRTP